jgi:hypothetical protein
MRRLPIALALATTILLGLTAASSMAAPRNQAVGDRLDLRAGDRTSPRRRHSTSTTASRLKSVTRRLGSTSSCSTWMGLH